MRPDCAADALQVADPFLAFLNWKDECEPHAQSGLPRRGLMDGGRGMARKALSLALGILGVAAIITVALVMFGPDVELHANVNLSRQIPTIKSPTTFEFQRAPAVDDEH